MIKHVFVYREPWAISKGRHPKMMNDNDDFCDENSNNFDDYGDGNDQNTDKYHGKIYPF